MKSDRDDLWSNLQNINGPKSDSQTSQRLFTDFANIIYHDVNGNIATIWSKWQEVDSTETAQIKSMSHLFRLLFQNTFKVWKTSIFEYDPKNCNSLYKTCTNGLDEQVFFDYCFQRH